ncbi:MAG: DUF1835 domain-containing protein [Dehalococcoidia bacterium]
MLHITNGESAGDPLRRAVSGTVVVWRDVLHDGPVPDVPDDELRRVRARFLANSGRAGELAEADILRDFEDRDAALGQLHDEVVLWFEHDLYDQLQLIQVLERLGRNPPARLSLICIDRHPDVLNFAGLGQLSDLQLAALFPTRLPVSDAQIDLARRTWAAFRAADPSQLAAIDDCAALPFLGAALHRLREEYPGLRDGLSRTERQILQILADGPTDRAELFRANARREEAIWLGDTSFFAILDGLSRGKAPLVEGDPLRLTESGRSVLAGEADQVPLNGIDRWVGGVRFSGQSVLWRWDGERIVPAWTAGAGD